MKYQKTLASILISTLFTLSQLSYAESNNGNFGEGNNGNGVGNTPSGNQGNDGTNGNAGGDHNNNGGGDHNNNGGGDHNNNGGGDHNNNGGGDHNNNGGGDHNNNGGGDHNNNGGGDHNNNGGGDHNNNGGGDHNNDGGGDHNNDGGGDHNNDGGSNGGGTNNNTTTTTKSDKWKVKLFPVVFGDYDVMKKIINLSATSGTGNESLVGTTGCVPHTRINEIPNTPLSVKTVTLDETSGGYMIERHMNYTVGLGAGAIFTNTAWSKFGIPVGVSAIKDAKTTFIKYVDDLRDEKETSYKIPFSAQELNDLKVGESVFYETEGGIVFGGAAGYGPLAAIGTTYVTQGGFRYFIEKEGCDTVKLQIMKDKINSAAVYAGNILTSISAEKLKDLSSGFSFRIYIGDKNAAHAYEEALKGDLTLLQNLAADTTDSSVQKVQTTEVRIDGSSKKFLFGLPFMWRKTETGQYVEASNVDYHEDDTKQVSTYGIFQKENKARLIGKHKEKAETFYGGIAELKDNYKGTTTSDYNGAFEWKYENDWGKTWKLRSAISELNNDTGLNEYLQINVPGENQDNLGYIELKAKVELPKIYVDALMESSNKNVGLRSLKDEAIKQLDNFCNLDQQDQRNCVETNKKKIDEKFIKISNSLQTMSKFVKVDPKAFAKAFAGFGEQIWTNQFIFKAVVNKGKTCGLTFTQDISGKRLSYVKKVFKFGPDTNCQL